MADKTKAASQKDEAREKGPGGPERSALDLSGDPVLKVIKPAKKRGYQCGFLIFCSIPCAGNIVRKASCRLP